MGPLKVAASLPCSTLRSNWPICLNFRVSSFHERVRKTKRDMSSQRGKKKSALLSDRRPAYQSVKGHLMQGDVHISGCKSRCHCQLPPWLLCRRKVKRLPVKSTQRPRGHFSCVRLAFPMKSRLFRHLGCDLKHTPQPVTDKRCRYCIGTMNS